MCIIWVCHRFQGGPVRLPPSHPEAPCDYQLEHDNNGDSRAGIVRIAQVIPAVDVVHIDVVGVIPAFRPRLRESEPIPAVLESGISIHDSWTSDPKFVRPAKVGAEAIVRYAGFAPGAEPQRRLFALSPLFIGGPLDMLLPLLVIGVGLFLMTLCLLVALPFRLGLLLPCRIGLFLLALGLLLLPLLCRLRLLLLLFVLGLLFFLGCLGLLLVLRRLSFFCLLFGLGFLLTLGGLGLFFVLCRLGVLRFRFRLCILLVMIVLRERGNGRREKQEQCCCAYGLNYLHACCLHGSKSMRPAFVAECS